jgi:hypothetical protein
MTYCRKKLYKRHIVEKKLYKRHIVEKKLYKWHIVEISFCRNDTYIVEISFCRNDTYIVELSNFVVETIKSSSLTPPNRAVIF